MSSRDDLTKILANLEISPEQAKVYLALLESGRANFMQLSQATGVKRTTLYLIIDKMEKRGLVNRDIEHKLIVPTPPAQLFENIQNHGLAFYHSLGLFQDLIKRETPLTKVRFYSGTKGIQKLLLDELTEYKKQKEKQLRVVGSIADLEQDPLFFRQYQKKRKELGIKTKLLAHPDVKPIEREYVSLNVQIKFLPSGIKHFHGRLSCTNQRVTLINQLSEQNGIIIESRGLAETFIQWFDVTWDLLTNENEIFGLESPAISKLFRQFFPTHQPHTDYLCGMVRDSLFAWQSLRP